jgi:predicted PurR-regulated permease PerM
MVGVGIWGAVAVGLIDNFLGPYLMSRGNSMHPFLILLAVLGGISAFGPIGFIVGPVLMSLFKVLLELYSVHISDQKHKVKKSS